MAEPKQRTWTDGKYACSTHEERWNCHEMFDTREAALAYAISEHAIDCGIEDGALVFTGQVKDLTAHRIACAVTDPDRVLDDMDEALYDLFGDMDDETRIEATADQRADLAALLQVTLTQWLTKHDLVPDRCTLEYVQSEVWHQCDHVNERNGGPSSTDRCVRHAGHDGDHEFHG